MAHRIRARLSAAEGRKFAFTVGTAFLAFGGIAWWRGHPTGAAVLGGVGGVLWLLGLTVPGRLGPVYGAWMGLALLLSKVTTPILMGVVYFVVLTPTGLLMRALGRNPLRSKGTAESRWVRRAAPGSDLNRQF